MKQRGNDSGQCFKTVSRLFPHFCVKLSRELNIARIPDGATLVPNPQKTQRIQKKSMRQTVSFSMSWRCLNLKADTRNILALVFLLARGRETQMVDKCLFITWHGCVTLETEVIIVMVTTKRHGLQPLSISRAWVSTQYHLQFSEAGHETLGPSLSSISPDDSRGVPWWWVFPSFTAFKTEKKPLKNSSNVPTSPQSDETQPKERSCGF